MQEIVNFFSFLINIFRQLLTLHNGFRRFMTLLFYIISLFNFIHNFLFYNIFVSFA